MSNLIDISVALDANLPVWPGSIGFRLEPLQRIEDGAVANVSRLDCDVHTGTHIDAPRHFVRDGATVEQISLDALVGPAHVAYLPEVKTVTAEVLDALALPSDTERLLLRTANSQLWAQKASTFQPEYVALTADAARWVVDHGLQVIGVDYLSVQRYDDGPEAHQILLESDVLIIEGLNLDGIASGIYELLCLPVKLAGAEGAPTRVVLRPTPSLASE